MTKKCGNCESDRMSHAITVVVVYCPNLPRGSYPLIPAEEYSICFNCHADIRLINKACESHPVVKDAGKWNSAVIVFDNGETLRVKNPTGQTMMA